MNREPDLANRIQRAEAIRAAFERKERFPSGDQLQAARNLHRVLGRAKAKPGFSIHNVLGADGVGLAGGGRTDSTKRLDTYVLPEDADEHRKARIAKKPAKYLALANAMAAELDEPAAVLVSQVFEGCSFGTEELPEGDWDSENWSRFAGNLKQMAAGVIRDHGVEDLWRKIRATNGGYDVRADAFGSASRPLSYLVEGWGLAGGSVCSDEIAPVPSIPLGRRLQGQPLPGWIFLEVDQSTEVEYLFWLEVRLALGPVNDHLSIGPLLEFRTNVEARMDGGQLIRFDNPFTDTSDIVKRAYIDGAEYPVHGLGLDEDALVADPEFRDDAEHSYFAWRELSPALLRALLDPDATDQETAFVPTNRHQGVWVKDLPPTRFSLASAAGVLNIDLLTGALEVELASECDRLDAGLDALRAEQGRAIREAEAEAMARWATKTASSPNVKRVDQ